MASEPAVDTAQAAWQALMTRGTRGGLASGLAWLCLTKAAARGGTYNLVTPLALAARREHRSPALHLEAGKLRLSEFQSC